MYRAPFQLCVCIILLCPKHAASFTHKDLTPCMDLLDAWYIHQPKNFNLRTAFFAMQTFMLSRLGSSLDEAAWKYNFSTHSDHFTRHKLPSPSTDFATKHLGASSQCLSLGRGQADHNSQAVPPNEAPRKRVSSGTRGDASRRQRAQFYHG